MIAELLWVVQSHSDDYHDNIKWVRKKLVPCFKRKYPGKQMVLVADNVPYHHKRKIGSLASLSKAKLVDLMVSMV